MGRVGRDRSGEASCRRSRRLSFRLPALPAYPPRHRAALGRLWQRVQQQASRRAEGLRGKIAAERAAKDAEFAASDDPIPKDAAQGFAAARVLSDRSRLQRAGRAEAVDDKTVFEMPTSTGTKREMRRVGSLEFTLKGRPLKLTVFVEVGADPNPPVHRRSTI